MGGRDHSCEGCGNGGFNNDEPCACYPYPDEPERTHWGGCYRTLKHHNCAVARVDRLEAENKRLREALTNIVAMETHATAICCECYSTLGRAAEMANVARKAVTTGQES